MTDLHHWIPAEELKLITSNDLQWLKTVFYRFSGFPSLEDIWALMDEPWKALDCNPFALDDRISAYYSHPVWLLNGLFIEQHKQSMMNRILFKDWVVSQAPKRVAEFGGGFGSLARMIGAALPSSFLEIIEPHPHPIALARAEKTINIQYQSKMVDKYEILLATDVFEHVPDPLQLVFETSQHLSIGGKYLIANCFYPVINCHLPQTFHFRHSWDAALNAMGMKPAEKVAYGRAYIRTGNLNLEAARLIEEKSEGYWKLTKYLSSRLAKPFTKLLF